MDVKISRRDVLAKAAMIGVGALVGGLTTGNAVAEEQALAKEWPWPYEKLDPAETAEIAYREWYNLGCGGTVVYSIFQQLAEKIGEPYKSFPVESFAIFEGGMVGWGTICGSVNGASIVPALIVGPPTWEEISAIIASNTMDWYSHANMPVYIPENPNANKDSIVQTVSDSPLCHVSVGKWMKASGFSLGSEERKDRCARVSASVAYRLVEKLNEWKDKGEEFYEEKAWSGPVKAGITSQYHCASCHGENVPKPPKPKK